MAIYRHRIRPEETCEAEEYTPGVAQDGKLFDERGEYVVTPMGSKSYLALGQLIVKHNGFTFRASRINFIKIWEPM